MPNIGDVIQTKLTFDLTFACQSSSESDSDSCQVSSELEKLVVKCQFIEAKSVMTITRRLDRTHTDWQVKPRRIKTLEWTPDWTWNWNLEQFSIFIFQSFSPISFYCSPEMREENHFCQNLTSYSDSLPSN